MSGQELASLEDFGIGVPEAAPSRVDPEDENYYVRPDPETGVLRQFPRVTKFVKHGADTYALDQWHSLYAGIGVARHRDLQHALAPLDPETDKQQAMGYIKQAQDRMAARSGATEGTALHLITERDDAGLPHHLEHDEDLMRDLQAYREVISAAGFEVVRQYRERTLCIKRDTFGNTVGEHGLCGTVDAFMRHRQTGELFCWDLKTGRSLKYAIGETKAQLACYSRADWEWVKVPGETHGGHWEPAPVVNQQIGYVLSLRPTTGIATAIKVDISNQMDFADPKNPIIGGWALALDAEQRRRTVNSHRRKVVAGWEPVVTVDLTQGEITYYNQ